MRSSGIGLGFIAFSSWFVPLISCCLPLHQCLTKLSHKGSVPSRPDVPSTTAVALFRIHIGLLMSKWRGLTAFDWVTLPSEADLWLQFHSAPSSQFFTKLIPNWGNERPLCYWPERMQLDCKFQRKFWSEFPFCTWFWTFLAWGITIELSLLRQFSTDALSHISRFIRPPTASRAWPIGEGLSERAYQLFLSLCTSKNDWYPYWGSLSWVTFKLRKKKQLKRRRLRRNLGPCSGFWPNSDPWVTVTATRMCNLASKYITCCDRTVDMPPL
jgi:hypothetical protein